MLAYFHRRIYAPQWVNATRGYDAHIAISLIRFRDNTAIDNVSLEAVEAVGLADKVCQSGIILKKKCKARLAWLQNEEIIMDSGQITVLTEPIYGWGQ